MSQDRSAGVGQPLRYLVASWAACWSVRPALLCSAPGASGRAAWAERADSEGGCAPVTSSPGLCVTGVGKASVLWGQLCGTDSQNSGHLSPALLRNHLVLPHVSHLPVVHTHSPGGGHVVRWVLPALHSHLEAELSPSRVKAAEEAGLHQTGMLSTCRPHGSRV